MAIKNLVYDLNPDEIFSIFTRDYDKYTKEEINDLILFLVDKSDNYVKAEKLVELCEDMTSEVNKVESNGSCIFSSYNLDTFVYNLSKFLYESTHIDVNEPIIIDENIYTNYLNYLGNDGNMFTTRLENNYIFNSCIHSKVGRGGNEFSLDRILNSWVGDEILSYFFNNQSYIEDIGTIRRLPIYLSFSGHNGVFHGWINNEKFSKIAGVFLPLPLSPYLDDDINLRSRLALSLSMSESINFAGNYSWYDFSTGDVVEGSFLHSHYGRSNPLGSYSNIVFFDKSYVLNCNLPNYIFKCYKDEGGIFQRTYRYYRDPSIWNSGYENNFPIITEYNPLEGDRSYRATPKFGKQDGWDLSGMLFENDKDFMQVIKKEDIKYQGSLKWMKNNFYISNFFYIPEIYIFIRLIYNLNRTDDVKITLDKIINDINSSDGSNGSAVIDDLILFFIKLYTIENDVSQLDFTTEDVQYLYHLQQELGGIINYLEGDNQFFLFDNSWGNNFVLQRDLKNYSLSNYSLINSDKSIEMSGNNWWLLRENVTQWFLDNNDVQNLIPNDFFNLGQDYKCCFFYERYEIYEFIPSFVYVYKSGGVLKIEEYIVARLFDEVKKIGIILYKSYNFGSINNNTLEDLENNYPDLFQSLLGYNAKKYENLQIIFANGQNTLLKIDDAGHITIRDITYTEIGHLFDLGETILFDQTNKYYPILSTNGLGSNEIFDVNVLLEKKILFKKILKKNDVKLLDQDITNVTIEGLEKSFHDWDNAPLYMIKTRYGKKENAIVKSNFLEKTLNDIRENNFIFVQNDVGEITPIDPTVEDEITPIDLIVEEDR